MATTERPFQELDALSSKRNLFETAIKLAAIPLMVACGGEVVSQTPPPVRLSNQPDAISTPDKPYFDRRFDTLIAAGKQLEAKFPTQFPNASRFTETLLRLVKDGEIDAESNDQTRFGTIGYTLKTGEDGKKIAGFTVKIILSGMFFNLPPEVQVMAFSHELGHQTDIKGFLSKYIGQDLSESTTERAKADIADQKVPSEAKEIWKNCQQLEVLKKADPSFKTVQPVPFEQKIPVTGNQSIYDMYLTYKNSSQGYRDPLWLNFIQRAYRAELFSNQH